MGDTRSRWWRGSSPRVWGRRRHRRQRRIPGRFIPTRVGQTIFAAEQRRLPWRLIPTRVGQTSRHGPGGGVCSRFIPTRVGQTSKADVLEWDTSGSSPRVWGRLLLDAGTRAAEHGSSPRVWGRHIVNTGVLGPKSRRSLQTHRNASGPHPTYPEQALGERSNGYVRPGLGAGRVCHHDAS